MNETIKYAKEDVIRSVASKTTCSLDTVRDVYETLEQDVLDKVSLADEAHSVVIKLFSGLFIKSVYQPEKEKLNNLTGKVIRTMGRICPKAGFTRSYCDKVNKR